MVGIFKILLLLLVVYKFPTSHRCLVPVPSMLLKHLSGFHHRRGSSEANSKVRICMKISKKVLPGETDKEFGEAEEAREGWEPGKLQWS